MPSDFSRRFFLGGSGALLAHGLIAKAQSKAAPGPAAPSAARPAASPGPATVAVIQGGDRRQNARDALVAIDDQIRPVLRQKKYVVIKPNNVSTVNPLAATNADAIQGILDYLEPRFRGPVVIAEASAGETMEGFQNFHYDRVAAERRSQHISLIDLNQEGRYQTMPLIDYDIHPAPVRLAARLLDPDAFIICSAILKTHNTVVATLSVKNMVLGAPLHFAPKETPRWNDKRRYHTGIRQTHYNMFLTAQKLRPFWGATLIDGFEGMEGNGPSSGTPVPSRVAIASTDYIAADRVGVECMGIDPKWIGYLNFCGQFGLGQFDLDKISIRGEKVATVQRKYQLHKDIERELLWMGPMTDLPPRLG
ncbi:MAG TPA: DUF362 domain-containing protein [Bryobacteraceae bacterium]|nr:DUF362 domain-containing protein [Bryobacteraceae bacterium]